MRFFNTAGPIKPELHYHLPPLERLHKEEVLLLIAQEKYFVLHAPRQTGKTSSLLALVAELNRVGQYRALYANVEVAQAARENVPAAMRGLLNLIAEEARSQVQDSFPADQMQSILARAGEVGPLFTLLKQWCEASPQRLVLVLDEIDSLVGDTLISVLRQLRSGYATRPAHFPQSVILCGVRDVRDYRIHSAKTQEIITGGSAFNIKAESLRLGNFTLDEIRTLYQQHTAETGQVFEPDIFPLVWELTGGQPWLVNALAYEVCFRPGPGRDRAQPITVALIEQAKEQLIERRDTHLDQLTDKLREERVRRVIEPVLAGEGGREQIPSDDVAYVRDLGLITTEGQIRIANRIYQEIIPRELVWTTQLTISQEPAWYISADGRLEMTKLLTAFQQFFREHSEHWVERFEYKEAGPQLLLQAFLQRIVNRGGRIEREYGLGRKRTDLLVIWPYPGGVQRVVLELKVANGVSESVRQAGLQQTWEYVDRCGAEAGHLVIFDRSAGKSWDEKIYHRTESYQGHAIEVWGM
jgi:hypothetical protein